ncbi:MAG TPA: hypothetical protein VFN41_13100 [Candidatus Limnocylindrales bacterium]|nr:hypothetical protein [Candidatus Limnocylindrales bacterium]
MTTWLERFKETWGRIRGQRPPKPIFADLRSMALTVDLATLHTPAEEPWSGAGVAMMEIGMDRAVASIVAIADGTVSMYTSTGGGVIGAGEHAAVRAEAARFRTVIADARGVLTRSTDFPLPEPGEVRFQARIGDDGFSAAAPESALRGGRHPLSTVYAAGQDLLTEIRVASEAAG